MAGRGCISSRRFAPLWGNSLLTTGALMMFATLKEGFNRINALAARCLQITSIPSGYDRMRSGCRRDVRNWRTSQHDTDKRFHEPDPR